MNLQSFFWTLLYCICNAASIFLLGDKNLIKGNLNNLESLFRILLNWKFSAAMLFAILARLSFVMINNGLLKNAKFENSSTTLTTFISLVSLVFIVVANYFFLGEMLSTKQVIGAAILLTGLFIMLN